MSLIEKIKLWIDADASRAKREAKSVKSAFEKIGDAMIGVNQGLELAGKAAAGFRSAMETASFAADLRQLEATVDRTFVRKVGKALGGTVDQLTLLRQASAAAGTVTAKEFEIIAKAADELTHRSPQFGSFNEILGSILEKFRTGETTELKKFQLELTGVGTRAEKTTELMKALQQVVDNPVAFDKGAEKLQQLQTDIKDAAVDMKKEIGDIFIALTPIVKEFMTTLVETLGAFKEFLAEIERRGLGALAGPSTDKLRKKHLRDALIKVGATKWEIDAIFNRGAGEGAIREVLDRKQLKLGVDRGAVGSRADVVMAALRGTRSQTTGNPLTTDEGVGKFGNVAEDPRIAQMRKRIKELEAKVRGEDTTPLRVEIVDIATPELKRRLVPGSMVGPKGIGYDNPFALGGLPGVSNPKGRVASMIREYKPSEMEKFREGFGKINAEAEMIEGTFNAANSAMTGFFNDMISGSDRSASAVVRNISRALRALGVEFGVRAIGATAMGLFGDSTKFPAAAKFAAASAAAFAGAAMTGALAGGGGGGGGGAVSAPGGGYSRTLPNDIQRNSMTINVNVGEGFVGRPEEIAAAIDDAVTKSRRKSRRTRSIGGSDIGSVRFS